MTAPISPGWDKYLDRSAPRREPCSVVWTKDGGLRTREGLPIVVLHIPELLVGSYLGYAYQLKSGAIFYPTFGDDETAKEYCRYKYQTHPVYTSRKQSGARWGEVVDVVIHNEALGTFDPPPRHHRILQGSLILADEGYRGGEESGE